MAVYKSRRKDAAAQFVADARELRKATVRIARKFPASYKKENLTLGDWPAMRGLHSLNHHSIRRPGRFLHGRGFTAALPRLHEQPLCSYFKPLRQTTQVREVMRPANRAPDRTLYGWDTALEAT